MLKVNNEKVELWKNRIEDCKSSGLTIVSVKNSPYGGLKAYLIK